MQTTHRLSRLIELNRKASEVLEFRYPDEEEQEGGHFLRNAAIAGAAGTGALYGIGRGVQGPVQGGLRGVGQTISKGAGMIGSSVSNAASGIKSTFMKGYQREGGGILRGIRGVARGLTKGKSRMVGLSSRAERLIELSSALDSVMEFAGGREEKDEWRTGNAFRGGLLGAAGTGAAAGIAAGGLAAAPDLKPYLNTKSGPGADFYKRAGQHMREAPLEQRKQIAGVMRKTRGMVGSRSGRAALIGIPAALAGAAIGGIGGTAAGFLRTPRRSQE